MDLAEVADTLYALAPAEFTPSRAEHVGLARAGGDRALATAIGALRRPTTAAWLVNQLVRRRPADLDELAELGTALRAAHHELDGSALRALSGRRHQVVSGLTAACRELGPDTGHPVSDAVARELESMFTAALADPDAVAVLVSGRLSSAKDLEDAAPSWPAADPGARSQLAADPGARSQLAADPAARPQPGARPQPAAPQPRATPEPATPKPATPQPPAPSPAHARAVAAARDELARRDATLGDALAADADAQRALDIATEDEAAAHRAVADRRAELTAAERREHAARQAAGAARRARADAERALREARRRREVAARRLAASSEAGPTGQD